MKVIIPGVVASFAAAALVSLAPAAHADAGQTVMIREGGFNAQLSDTRATGHVEFLKDGLHVWTEGTNSSDKAAEYIDTSLNGLPSSASVTWYGTTPQPGSQIVFDADGDATTKTDAYNVLVGEPVYGDDYWYTGGTTRAAQRGFTCPETSGGSGSDCHGTLAQWQALFPHAHVYAVGFSLGSGVKGDGVIHDLKVDSTDYQFTKVPAAPVPTKVRVAGSATVTRSDFRKHSEVRMHFVTEALGANQVQGRKLTFKVTDNGQVVYRSAMNADASSFLRLSFAQGSGRHAIQILKNGRLDQTVVLRMGS